MTPPPQPSAPPDAPRVILAAWPDLPPLRELLLALATRGQTILLWLAPGAPAADASAVLELQLELTRAGGIVLVHEDSSLQAAAEALGRIDLGLAWNEGEAGAIARAAALLERDRRPARILMLRPEGISDADGPRIASGRIPSETAPGVKFFEMSMQADSPGDLAGRIMAWSAMMAKP